MIGQAIPVIVVVPSAGALEAVRGVTPPEVQVTVAARERAAEAAGSGHLALVGDGVRLAPGWLDGLIAAVGDDGTVATAGALVLADGDAGEVAERLCAAAARPRPRTPAPDWACTLVTRAALELAGPLDEGFARRCSERGLLHVVAGDVPAIMAAPGVDAGPTPGADAAATPGADDAEPRPRGIDVPVPEPLARTRARGRALARGLSVTVDARILREPVAGTQVHTLELLAALHRTEALHLRILVPPDPTPTAQAVLDGLAGAELLNSAEVDDDTPATDVVHRPYQVSSALDLLTLKQVGTRLVVTHQDLLTYHNPAYHRDEHVWAAYRDLTRAALSAAYVTVAFSEHAAADLRAEELVGERLRVVPIGVDHRLSALAAEPRPPQVAAKLDGLPYLLCLGSDLAHKNRPFAIALTAALRERGWNGRLVLAGPHARDGSSAAEEAERRAAAPGLVLDGGVPDEAEKAWLYAHAAAVVYPTTYEGFGLVPFEAAAHGTPCLFAPQAALIESVGDHATLVPWDPAASAERALELLTPGPARDGQVAGIRAVAERLTWDRTAATLLRVYEEALDARLSEASWEALEAEERRSQWEDRYWSIGRTGLSLVGPDRLLPEATQRALAALARRPLTRRPLLKTLDLVGRLGQGGRE
jgi:glycosyltransferase involved in cell wall biosynthesis